VKDKAAVQTFLQEQLPNCAVVFTYASEEQHAQMIEEKKKLEEKDFE